MSANPFEQALGWLDTYGWIKGRSFDDDGSACAMGALAAGTGYFNHLSMIQDEDEEHRGRYLAAVKMLERALPGYCDSIPQFNDAETTSEEDVRLLLKQAAGTWEEAS